MSNPVKDRSGVGLPPKAERRAAGKIAAAQRARAKRRKRIVRTALQYGLPFLAVAGVIAFATGVFKTDAAPQAEASAEASAAVLDPALSTKPTVTAGTGELTQLGVSTIVEGTGAAVQANQTIKVNYVGVSYTSGEEFDSSWSGSPPEPAEFKIGAGAVIAGWDQGLVGVKVGSRVQLDIPTDLAYGADAAAQGKPAGPLRFVVDILSAA